MQHRMMFHRGRNDMPPFGFEHSRHTKNRQIIALRAAAGKNNLARLAFQDVRRAVAKIIQPRPRFAPHVMHGRWVTPNNVPKRQHRLPHRRIQRRGGVVIEINRFQWPQNTAARARPRELFLKPIVSRRDANRAERDPKPDNWLADDGKREQIPLKAVWNKGI